MHSRYLILAYEWVMSHMRESYQHAIERLNQPWWRLWIRQLLLWLIRGILHWRMNESRSCDTSTTHVTYEWVMSYMHESCQMWTTHIAHGDYERVMSRLLPWLIQVQSWRHHTNHACYVWMRHVTYEWVMPRMHESCHIWTNRIVHEIMNESCHGSQCCNDSLEILHWFINESWSCAMNESCHVCMSYVTSTTLYPHSSSVGIMLLTKVCHTLKECVYNVIKQYSNSVFPQRVCVQRGWLK